MMTWKNKGYGRFNLPQQKQQRLLLSSRYVKVLAVKETLLNQKRCTVANKTLGEILPRSLAAVKRL
jgi:hypothetical protein